MLKSLGKKLLYGMCIGVGVTLNSLALAAPDNFVPEVNAQLSSTNKASIEWNKGDNNDIQAIGIGLPPAGYSHARGRVLARRAAIVDAQRNLLEYINGVSLDADTTVSLLAIESDVIRTKVSGIIQNANIIRERYNADGSYEIVLSVPMYGENKSLASVVIPKMVANLPQETITKIDDNNYAGTISDDYTGVVVDAAGLGLDTTFAPVIYDTKGRIIYGLQKVDYSFVIKHGLVEYVTNVNDTGRAGNKPLVVKAVSVRGGKNSVNMVNVVVSKEDADKIVAADKRCGFSNNCSVVFVK